MDEFKGVVSPRKTGATALRVFFEDKTQYRPRKGPAHATSAHPVVCHEDCSITRTLFLAHESSFIYRNISQCIWLFQ